MAVGLIALTSGTSRLSPNLRASLCGHLGHAATSPDTLWGEPFLRSLVRCSRGAKERLVHRNLSSRRQEGGQK